MTLLGHRPREVYRVYSQGEFLDGAAQRFLDGVERQDVGEDAPPATNGGERRLRRLAGAAMLAGAMGAVGGVVATHGPRAQKNVRHVRGASVAARSRAYLAERPAPRPKVHPLARTRTGAGVRSAGTRHPREAVRQRRKALANAVSSSKSHIAARFVAVSTTVVADTSHVRPEFGFER